MSSLRKILLAGAAGFGGGLIASFLVVPLLARVGFWNTTAILGGPAISPQPIESPKAQGVTGDDVGRLFVEKKYLDIAKYNVLDLRATKALYEKWDTNLRF